MIRNIPMTLAVVPPTRAMDHRVSQVERQRLNTVYHHNRAHPYEPPHDQSKDALRISQTLLPVLFPVLQPCREEFVLDLEPLEL
jgi:hypothetical protein